MKFKTSFIDSGILRNDFKRFSWIGVTYLIGLLLTLPLAILMTYSRLELSNAPWAFNDSVFLPLFQFHSFIQLMVLIPAPILAGLLLFQYLQEDKASIMVHTLPFKREVLYNTHILAGIVLLGLPIIITALITWALVAGLGLPGVNGYHVLSWCLFSLLFNLLFFMTTAAVGMVTGMSGLQGILSVILLILPGGLYMLLVNNFSMYTYGFASSYYTISYQNYAPLVRILGLSHMSSGEITIYLLLIAILYISGRYLYKMRKLENAGNAITFNVLQPIFKYGVTFCCMLLTGSVFYTMQGELTWTYCGYLIGSLLAYFLVEILLTKSPRIFNRQTVKGYGIFSSTVILLIILLNLDVTGYEKRLPAPADIESIYLSGSFYGIQMPLEHYSTSLSGVNYKLFGFLAPVYKETSSIASIYSLHQAVLNKYEAKNPDHMQVEGYSPREEFTSNYQRFCLAYTLKNGSLFCREYEIDRADYVQILKPFYESFEYKYLNNPLLSVNAEQINAIQIQVSETDNKVLYLSDKQQIIEAADALAQDILNEKYEDMGSQNPAWAHLSIFIGDNTLAQASWQRSYTNFEQWLKNNGYYNQARLMPEDIQRAIVIKVPLEEDMSIDKYSKYAQNNLLTMEQDPSALKISDPDYLEICLNNYSYGDRQPYAVTFVLKNGARINGVFTETHVPAFIKDYFAS